MRRVTADSNILVSAFLRGGKPLELLELARAGQIELAMSDDILNETARVLGTKFTVPADDVEAFGHEVRGFSRLVTPTEKLDAVPQDPTDNTILECAVEAVRRRSSRVTPTCSRWATSAESEFRESRISSEASTRAVSRHRASPTNQRLSYWRTISMCAVGPSLPSRRVVRVPDDPVALHTCHSPCGDAEGLRSDEQTNGRAGRASRISA